MLHAQVGEPLRTRKGTAVALPPGAMAIPGIDTSLMLVATRLGLSEADVARIESASFRCGQLEISAIPFFLLRLMGEWTAAAPINSLRYNIEPGTFMRGGDDDVVPVPFVLANAVKPETGEKAPDLLDGPRDIEGGGDTESTVRAIRILRVPASVGSALRVTLRMQTRSYGNAAEVQEGIESIRKDFDAEQLAQHADLHPC